MSTRTRRTLFKDDVVSPEVRLSPRLAEKRAKKNVVVAVKKLPPKPVINLNTVDDNPSLPHDASTSSTRRFPVDVFSDDEESFVRPPPSKHQKEDALQKWRSYLLIVSAILALSGVIWTLDTFLPSVQTMSDSATRVLLTLPDFLATSNRHKDINLDELVSKLLASSKFQSFVLNAVNESEEEATSKLQTTFDKDMAVLRRSIQNLKPFMEKDALMRDLETVKEDWEFYKKTLDNFKRKLTLNNDDKTVRIQSLEVEMSVIEEQLRQVELQTVNAAKDVSEKLSQALITSLTGDDQHQDWMLLKDMPETKKLVGELRTRFVDGKQLQSELDTALEALKSDIKRDIEDRVLSSESLSSHVQNLIKMHRDTFTVSGNFKPHFSKEELTDIVKNKLVTYDADKTGQFDFALESAGGLIESTRCTKTYDKASAVYTVWGIPIWSESTDPRMILRPGTQPGQCWAFHGSEGSVVIRLSNKISVTGVTLEHIPPLLSPDGSIASAPKDVSIYGLSHLSDAQPKLLGNFTYLDDGSPIQTYKTSRDIHNIFELIEVQILSNHGNPAYTCLYRVRVHGNLP